MHAVLTAHSGVTAHAITTIPVTATTVTVATPTLAMARPMAALAMMYTMLTMVIKAAHRQGRLLDVATAAYKCTQDIYLSTFTLEPRRISLMVSVVLSGLSGRTSTFGIPLPGYKHHFVVFVFFFCCCFVSFSLRCCGCSRAVTTLPYCWWYFECR